MDSGIRNWPLFKAGEAHLFNKVLEVGLIMKCIKLRFGGEPGNFHFMIIHGRCDPSKGFFILFKCSIDYCYENPGDPALLFNLSSLSSSRSILA